MRSINQILDEAWTEVKNSHGIALEHIYFDSNKTIDGHYWLNEITITASPTHKATGEQQ